MLISPGSFTPLCRRACLARTRQVRQYAAASSSALRTTPRPASEPLSKKEKERKRLDEEKKKLEDERLKMDIVQRRETPYSDPLSIQMPIQMLALTAPVSWSVLKGVGWRGRIRWVWDRGLNWFASRTSLVLLARAQSLPFVSEEQQPTTFRAIWLSPRNSRPSGVRAQDWLAPFRKEALNMYKGINEAIASRNMHTVRELCRDEYLQEVLRRQRAYDRDTILRWQLHGEASPTRCVSFRQAEVPSVTGTTFRLVHALVRFDTMQSLTVTRAPSIQKGRRIAAPVAAVAPKRVVEYIVFEGRIAESGSRWMIRAQLYDDAGEYKKSKKAKVEDKADKQ